MHEISNNMVCATSKASDQPAHTRSLIRAFACPLSILWLLSYWLNIFGDSKLERRLYRLAWVYTCHMPHRWKSRALAQYMVCDKFPHIFSPVKLFVQKCVPCHIIIFCKNVKRKSLRTWLCHNVTKGLEFLKSSISDGAKFIQCSAFILLCLESIGMDCVISEWTVLLMDPVIKGQFYKGIVGKWPQNSFVKFHGRKILKATS